MDGSTWAAAVVAVILVVADDVVEMIVARSKRMIIVGKIIACFMACLAQRTSSRDLSSSHFQSKIRWCRGKETMIWATCCRCDNHVSLRWFYFLSAVDCDILEPTKSSKAALPLTYSNFVMSTRPKSWTTDGHKRTQKYVRTRIRTFAAVVPTTFSSFCRGIFAKMLPGKSLC